MGLFKPNINKLSAAKDVAGLRAALGHKDPQVRHGAARALGLIELPPTTTQRQGIVPQEAVADLLACWRVLLAESRTSGPGQKPRFQDFGEAIARIGGPAGVEALIGLDADKLQFWWMQASEVEVTMRSVFALLGIDDLIAILLDDHRSMGLRATVHRALRQIGHSPTTAAADAARVSEAIAEYERRQEQRELESIEQGLDWLTQTACYSGDPGSWQKRIRAIDDLARSRNPRAIEALVNVVLEEDLVAKVREAAREALIRIGGPVVGHLVPKLSEPHLLVGVYSAHLVLEKVLEREGSDLAEGDLLSIASLGETQGIVYHSRLEADDTSTISEERVLVDFSDVSEAARQQLARRRPQSDEPVPIR